MRWMSGLVAGVAVAAACHTDGAPPPAADRGDPIPCSEPRPQICTKEYRPVCGTRDTGIRCVTAPCDSSEPRSYGNACTACSDPKVGSYVAGACEDAGPPQGDDTSPRDSIR